MDMGTISMVGGVAERRVVQSVNAEGSALARPVALMLVLCVTLALLGAVLYSATSAPRPGGLWGTAPQGSTAGPR